MYFAKPKLGIRTRLTLLYLAVFGTTLIVFSVVLYQGFISTHQREFDVALYNYAIDVSRSVDLDLFGGVTLKSNFMGPGEKVLPFALGNAFLEIQTLDGQILARSRNLYNRDLPVSVDVLASLPKSGFIIQTVDLRPLVSSRDQAPYRMISYFVNRIGPMNFALHIAVPMTLLQREKRGLIFLFGGSIPVILLIATFAGLYLSRRALAPVDAIISKARGISPRQLSERVPVPESNDEIRRLALTLNALLDRLQQTFESQEKFIADASHELKTPLAILRGEIDIMMSRQRSPEELAEFLASASQEVGYLSRIVEDLLILARIDAGTASLSPQALRLDELILETVERAEKLAVTKGVRFRIHLAEEEGENPPISGDPDLVRCLIFNLLENAVKFSPKDAVVDINLDRDPRSSRITIRDQGPGISAEEVSKIFDRFYRSSTTRDKVSGSGLGLTLARRIAEVHQGKISVNSRPGQGAAFTFELPNELT